MGKGASDAEKNKLKPWLIKSWCIATITPLFIKRMEAILALYRQPYNPRRPQVSFDEASHQLLDHTRPPVPAQPGHARKEDYEYERRGTRNLFVFVEPKTGQRAVLVTRHRKKRDFAYAMRYLVDVLYPEADCIDLVVEDARRAFKEHHPTSLEN